MKFTLRNVFLVILFAGILYFTLMPVSDPDFLWHLRTGELIAQLHAIPHTDPYSFSFFGKPWITQEWLSELLIFWLYQLGGYNLLIIIFAFIITLTFFFTYLRCPQESKPYTAGFTLFLGVLMSYTLFGIRPQMISLLLTSLFLYLLDKYKKTQQIKYILFLPIITLIWVNLHAGYLLGLVLILFYITGGLLEWLFEKYSKKESPTPVFPRYLLFLTGVFVLGLFAALINPNGFKILIYPFQTLTDSAMQQYIKEWQSPNFHLNTMLPMVIMILSLIGLGMFGKQRIPITQILLTLVFGFEALHSIRNIPLFALVCVPVLSEEISSWVKIQSNTQIPKRFIWLIPIFFACIAVILVHDFIRISNFQSTEIAESYPQAAVDWISENQPQGRIFNAYDWGGYLIWRLYPKY